MNQILYVGENKGNGPIAIKSIVKFFAIIIIAFGIILIGKGSYAIYKNIEINSGDNIPVVYMNRVNNTVVIKAEDNIEISKLIYSWNKGEETILLPNSKKVEEVVLLPNENSVLNVTIVDTKGKETKFMQEWNIEGTDIRKPEIEITTSLKVCFDLFLKKYTSITNAITPDRKTLHTLKFPTTTPLKIENFPLLNAHIKAKEVPAKTKLIK